MASWSRLFRPVQLSLQKTSFSIMARCSSHLGRNHAFSSQQNIDTSSTTQHNHISGLATEQNGEHISSLSASGNDEISKMAHDLKIDKLELAEKIIRYNRKECESSIGSGIGGKKLCSNICANWNASEAYACENVGIIACPSCNLVTYCSLECKEEDWDKHRHHCQSILMEVDWKPAFVIPSSGAGLMLKHSEFLWGNVPAYGILGQSVRASELPVDMHLCFAASGDLRNVIETVSQLPDEFTGQVTVHINDHNPMIIARNFLMLKLLQLYGYESIDTVIAVWYSTGLTACQSIVTDCAVLDSIREVANVSKIGQKKHEQLRLDFPSSLGSTLVVDVGAEVWTLLANMSANTWSIESIKDRRREKLQSEQWKLDRKLACLRPSHRVAWKEFQEQGLLLPFGAYNVHHSSPNKFLLDPNHGWTMSEDADPLSGWHIMDSVSTGMKYGVSSADLYGCLFFHLREKLSTFIQKLEKCKLHFRLSCGDASHMAKVLLDQKVKLHCVDTSNIADANYCGIRSVLHDWAPLLDRSSGYESTLITFFMNWAELHTPSAADHVTFSKLTWKDIEAAIAIMAQRKQSDLKGLMEILSISNQYGKLSILNYFHDFDGKFSEYLSTTHADSAAAMVGLERRRNHCIIPHCFSVRSKARDDFPGKHASYEQCYYDTVVSNLNFTEQFVEWCLERMT